MNKAKLKSYAPQARKDFIAAVVARANLLGISEKNGKLEIAPSEKRGDVTLIAGQAWPANVHEQRERLIKRMQKIGAGETAEAIAYTWFNRFAALRFMEIHDYLGHGYRVLSSREGGLPEILTHATELAGVLPGLNAQQIADMKLAGNKDGELYRLLLVAQCNALSNAMPFLFERIDDESELLLPGNLERTDSVIAKLVEAIPEEDWNEVEVIGWLYQFYISEKKDEVIGKVVKSEDIPAATQLFTPNWIVQYLVQNSVGRLWLMANPSSSLKSQWPYYIEPAEQTPEVQAQLDALIKKRMDEDGGSPLPGEGSGVRGLTLNPETITVLDPACGSGHILVEAYEVLKGIYLERGYQARSIPRLILEKNLYGLDIDDRAAQLAGFALLMKARADDRRLLDSPVRLNVLSMQESAGMDLDEFTGHLNPHGVNRTVLGALLDTFAHAKTFGSLIQIPKGLENGLAGLEDDIAKAIENGDVFAKAAAQDLVPLVQQAKILAMQFDAVVANPPYMGGKGMNATVKDFALAKFPKCKSDLFAMFIERGFDWCKHNGFNSMVTMQSWMFLSSFEEMRRESLLTRGLGALLHLPYDGKGPTAMGISFGIALAIFTKKHIQGLSSNFDCFRYYELSEDGIPLRFPSRNERNLEANSDDFSRIPGCPVAYWLPERYKTIFEISKPLNHYASARQGLATSDNARFLRAWYEVSIDKTKLNAESATVAFASGKRWFPYNKGGAGRKWYGNQEFLIRFDRESRDVLKTLGNHLPSEALYFKPMLGWSKVTSASISFRLFQAGFLFDVAGTSIFSERQEILEGLSGLLNSKVIKAIIESISSTLNFEVGAVAQLPVLESAINLCLANSREAILLAKKDWDSSETSWDFVGLRLLTECGMTNLNEAWLELDRSGLAARENIRRLEEENNRILIKEYGLQDELSPEVPDDQITLTRADREKDSQRLVSYAVGCMMGRYSLDEPGLIYAHVGNVGFDATRYKTFPADADGIIPITDELWFEDDAANRIREFILAVWPAPTFEENMAWLAESLGTKGSETPAETIRRYLASSFFKDHLQTYKKRPIYWLFSSGRQGAFQALVYLHRYHEGTLPNTSSRSPAKCSRVSKCWKKTRTPPAPPPPATRSPSRSSR